MGVMKNKGKWVENGFTILEIIVVLVLIAIVSAVVISRISSTSEISLAGQTEVIKSHIRYAQARAMNTNKVWGVSRLTDGSYSVFSLNPAKTYMLVLGQDNVAINLPTDMTMIFTGTDDISFDQWGQPYDNDSGTGASSTKTVTVSYDAENISFSITQNTGFIP